MGRYRARAAYEYVVDAREGGERVARSGERMSGRMIAERGERVDKTGRRDGLADWRVDGIGVEITSDDNGPAARISVDLAEQ